MLYGIEFRSQPSYVSLTMYTTRKSLNNNQS